MPRHHVFLSYSRQDNLPAAEGGEGWVSAFERHLRDRYRRRTGRELRLFFDTTAIEDGRDWRRELGAGLRESRLMIAFLSPRYLASPYCQWEWEQYVRREHSAARGDDGIAQVFFVLPQDLSAGDDERMKAMLEDLRRRQAGRCELVPWLARGPQVLDELDAAERSQAVKNLPRDPAADLRPLAERLQALDRYVARRLDRIALAELAPGNVARSHAHFVGRHRELRALHDVLSTGAAPSDPGESGRVGHPGGLGGLGGHSVIAAAHSPGGLGKTALARQYAHAYADHYATGGTWELACEGIEHLGRAMLRLAEDAQFLRLSAEVGRPYRLSDAARLSDDAALAEVLGQLHTVAQARVDTLRAALRHHADRHSPDDEIEALHLAPRTLLILDNVDQPALLTAEALAELPEAAWLELLVTTRLDPREQIGCEDWHVPIEVTPLPDADALELLREHQPRGRFTTEADDAAARAIVAALGGYTLAVELVAAYLGHTARLGFGPRDYLRRLQDEGLASVDQLASEHPVAQQIRHADKRVGPLLAWSVERLSASARTTLAFASRLRPDRIRLDWLHTLVQGRHPDALVERPGYPSPWAEVWLELHGLRLLHPADAEDTGDSADSAGAVPTYARIHRLVADMQRLAAPADFDPTPDIESLFEILGTNFENQARWGSTETLHLLHRDLRDQLDYLITYAPTGIILRQAQVVADFESLHYSLKNSINFTKRILESKEKILLHDPESSTAIRDALISANKLAGLLERRGENDSDADYAIRLIRYGLKIRQNLQNANPQSDAAANEVSFSLEKLADILSIRGYSGDAEQAMELYLQSLDIREQIFQKSQKSKEAARNLSVNLEGIADLLCSMKQKDYINRCADIYKRCVEIRNNLFQSDPESDLAKRDLSISLARLAHILGKSLKSDDIDQAIQNIDRSLKLSEELLLKFPYSIQAAADVAANIGKYADLLCARDRSSDRDHAKILLERNIEIARTLFNDNTAPGEADLGLIVALEKLGGFYARNNDTEILNHGLERQMEAIEIARRLVAKHGKTYRFVRPLAVGLFFGAKYSFRLKMQLQTQSLLGELVSVLQNWRDQGGSFDPEMEAIWNSLTNNNQQHS